MTEDARGPEPGQSGADPAEVPEWMQRLNEDRDAVIPLMPAGRRPSPPPRDEPVKSGILVIDKPAGQTSHDVVQAVRRAAELRRIGHAGTLDPMATGVLVLALGSATRVIDEVQAMPKVYRARLRLGETTDTYDREGEIVERRDSSGIQRQDVEAALESYRGEIEQVPPMYSALRHEGRRLYELAREGKEIEREPRRVRVDRLEITAWEAPELALEMQVSKGTYVRSIAHDLGQDLGVGAHLTSLERSAVGHFRVEESEPLTRVVEAFLEGWWPALIHPLDAALLHHSAMLVDDDQEAALRMGQQIEAAHPDSNTTDLVRVYDRDGRFVALVRWDDLHQRWQPDKVFPRPGG